ncbi:MAG TPA: molybdopterin molybdenumtransferase MoeA, partial [Stellaceae bacterium]|nr:molybdopterin molybdenumtransferase MoeA [Stellaceae bacterium]
MAQLSEDCFAFGEGLLEIDKALELVDERIHPMVEPEAVPLVRALGRVLAADRIAGFDLPPYDNSAVDGYAVHFADLLPDRETVLPVGGRAAAGHPLDRPAGRGEAIRIFTGAPMPAGPDTVMMQEDCLAEAGRVRFKPGIRQGANRRAAGEDVACGALALPA